MLIGYGKDQQCMASYFMGFKTSVGSSYNFCGKIWNEGIQALKNGNHKLAAEKQITITQMQHLIYEYGYNESVTKVSLTDGSLLIKVFYTHVSSWSCKPILP